MNKYKASFPIWKEKENEEEKLLNMFAEPRNNQPLNSAPPKNVVVIKLINSMYHLY